MSLFSGESLFDKKKKNIFNIFNGSTDGEITKYYLHKVYTKMITFIHEKTSQDISILMVVLIPFCVRKYTNKSSISQLISY